MGRQKANKHLHRLVKVGPIWKCAIMDCTYFLHEKQAYALPGFALCWKCGLPFPFDERARQEIAAMCENCADVPELPDHILNGVKKND